MKREVQSMKKKIISVLIAMMMFGVCGCSSQREKEMDSSKTEDMTNTTTESQEHTDILEDVTTEQKEQIAEKKSTEEKTHDLHNIITLSDMISQKEPSKNVILSDTSLNMALALLAEGATGEAREDICKYLGNDLDVIQEYDNNLMKSYDSEKNMEIYLANSVWTDQSITLKPEYKQLVEKYYHATANSLDFTDEKSADKINDWCNEKTQGLIPDIIDSSTLSSAKNVLLNALYFNGDWEKPFEEYQVIDESFYNMDQSTKQVKMLTDTVDTYYENDKAIGFAKYYEGREVAFIGILPKEEGDFSLAELQIPELLSTSTTEYEVDMMLPKFILKDSNVLNDALKECGLEKIFEGGSFGNMSDVDLYVDTVLQKTCVEVNEKGTKAAAITEAIMLETCMVEEEDTKKYVHLDRPFAFMIYDTKNQECLFVGKITNLK